MVKKGDVVKLNDRFAAALMALPKNRTDWKSRSGTVSQISKDRQDIGVMWTGRSSPERLPIKAVVVL